MMNVERATTFRKVRRNIILNRLLGGNLYFLLPNSALTFMFLSHPPYNSYNTYKSVNASLFRKSQLFDIVVNIYAKGRLFGGQRGYRIGYIRHRASDVWEVRRETRERGSDILYVCAVCCVLYTCVLLCDVCFVLLLTQNVAFSTLIF